MITTSDKVDLIAPALISVLDKMQASKDGKNPHFRSDYMTLDGILNTVKPLLKEVDIGVLQSIETEDRTIKCNTHLLHSSGQYINCTAAVHAEKDTPQGFGSAITYARRYGIAAALGIADCEDDDGNGAEKASAKKPVTAKAKPTSKPTPAPTLKPQVVKLTEEQLDSIVVAFSGIGVEIWDLEKEFGNNKEWTNVTRKSLLVKYEQLAQANKEGK